MKCLSENRLFCDPDRSVDQGAFKEAVDRIHEIRVQLAGLEVIYIGIEITQGALGEIIVHM
jgi:hypothetical protein